MNEVTSKHQFYKLFSRGCFGNTSPAWNTYEQYLQSGYQKPIAVRTRLPGHRCDYFVAKENVLGTIASFLSDGYSENQLHFSAQCPEQDKLLQGEVQLTANGLYLFGSTNVNYAMRDALKRDSFHMSGLQAHLFVKNRMCPNSWEWLQELFQLYPDHVIEFTTLRYCWGTVPAFNTLFWEVRKY